MQQQRTDLHDAVHRAADPLVLMQRVAEAAMSLIDGCQGALVGLLHEDGELRFVCGAGYLSGEIGGGIPLDSLSGLAVRTGEVLRCDDATSDPRVHAELCRRHGVSSVVSVPLARRGEPIGVLDVASSRPAAFDDRDVATLTRLAAAAGVVVGAAADLADITVTLRARAVAQQGAEADPGLEERFVADVLTPGLIGDLRTTRSLGRFLAGDGVEHLFQPIFDIVDGRLLAVEALARFAGEPLRSPDEWFAEAHLLGCGTALEVASVRVALRALPQLPSEVALCVNAGPEALTSDEVHELVAASDAQRVVMELTEQVKVTDYPRLVSGLRRLRHLGARVAIDDTGAGFASFAHILKLSPDIIKLDRDLTSGIDRDPVRRSLAAALVTFAAQTGAEIVAEGIESAAELDTLRELGIRVGQGYLLGRPVPAEQAGVRLAPELLGRHAS